MSLYLNHEEASKLLNALDITCNGRTLIKLNYLFEAKQVDGGTVLPLCDQICGFFPKYKEKFELLLAEKYGTWIAYDKKSEQNRKSILILLEEVICNDLPIDNKEFWKIVSVTNNYYDRKTLEMYDLLIKKLKKTPENEIYNKIKKIEDCFSTIDCTNNESNFNLAYEFWRKIEKIKPLTLKSQEDLPKFILDSPITNYLSKEHMACAFIKIAGTYKMQSAKPVIEKLHKNNAKIITTIDEVFSNWGLKSIIPSKNINLFSEEEKIQKYHYMLTVDAQKLKLLIGLNGEKFKYILQTIGRSVYNKFEEIYDHNDKTIHDFNDNSLIFKIESPILKKVENFEKYIKQICSDKLIDFLNLQNIYNKTLSEFQKTSINEFSQSLNDFIDKAVLHDRLSLEIKENSPNIKKHKI